MNAMVSFLCRANKTVGVRSLITPFSRLFVRGRVAPRLRQVRWHGDACRPAMALSAEDAPPHPVMQALAHREAAGENTFESAAEASEYETSFGISQPAIDWLVESTRIAEHCEAAAKLDSSANKSVLGPDPYAEVDPNRDAEEREAELRLMWEAALNKEANVYEWRLRPGYEHLDGEAVNLAMRAPLQLASWDVWTSALGAGALASVALQAHPKLRVCSVEPLAQSLEALRRSASISSPLRKLLYLRALPRNCRYQIAVSTASSQPMRFNGTLPSNALFEISAGIAAGRLYWNGLESDPR